MDKAQFLTKIFNAAAVLSANGPSMVQSSCKHYNIWTGGPKNIDFPGELRYNGNMFSKYHFSTFDIMCLHYNYCFWLCSGGSFLIWNILAFKSCFLTVPDAIPLFSTFYPTSSYSASFFWVFTSFCGIRFPNFISKNWKIRQARHWKKYRRN